ncbi:MAG: DUF4174 domain-containing protein [Cyclobacteriaceae bacterium]
MTFIMSKSAFSQELAVPGDYHWQNRILLVFASPDENKFEKQLQIFSAEEAGLQERELVIFKIRDRQVIHPTGKTFGKVSARQLREQYEVKREEFAVVLIGKDGSQKLKQEEILETDKLFAIIDAMPMRRREMREDRGD